MRIVLMGNAGSGKSTMAARLVGVGEVARLSLDEIAWNEGAERKPLEESLALLDQFLSQNDNWVIEGCYGDLVEAVLPHCDELRFLNPGVPACIAHCRGRPWEPGKFDSLEKQRQMLDHLLEWVKEYETRDDEYGLKRHKSIFESFAGKKRAFCRAEEYGDV